MKVELTLTQGRKVAVFADGISPQSFVGKGAEEIGEIAIREGNTLTKISDLFKVKVAGKPANTPAEVEVTLTGDFSKFRYLGRGMTAGKLNIQGHNGGFYLGQEMTGGTITVEGDVGSWAGSMMRGGKIKVSGNAGDYLAAPYRGSQEGMQGGIITVHGNVGNEAGRSMRGGQLTIGGNAGEFLGAYMNDGAILLKGDCPARPGAGMRGGRIVILDKLSELLPGFTYVEVKEKAKLGKEKIPGSFYVYTGDTVNGGNGKLFISRCINRHLNPEGEIFPEPVSVNEMALPYVEEMMRRAEKLNIAVIKHPSSAVVIDAGVEVKGCEEAGRLVTLTCLGGLANVSIGKEMYGDMEMATVEETTDAHPATVTLGSQYAGWAIQAKNKAGKKVMVMGSGPARAISQQPKKLYQKICYKDSSNIAVILLETDELPSDAVVKQIAEECRVQPNRLYIIAASTSSIVGSVQIAGRIVETGIHKLTEVGFNPNKIISGKGTAPIAPVHPQSEVAMGITNDMILYGGKVYYEVTCKSDDEIGNIIDNVPSISSRDYGRPFYQIFKDAGGDFYKIDPALFAPAKITVKNMKTGSIFTAGEINAEILKQSLALMEKAETD